MWYSKVEASIDRRLKKAKDEKKKKEEEEKNQLIMAFRRKAKSAMLYPVN